jgi:hypothetical protein
MYSDISITYIFNIYIHILFIIYNIIQKNHPNLANLGDFDTFFTSNLGSTY